LLITEHQQWVRTPIFHTPAILDHDSMTDSDMLEDGDALDISGDEVDAWLQQAVTIQGQVTIQGNNSAYNSGTGYVFIS
jgi:hypothetical protein